MLSKKRKIDFILQEDDISKLIFRFYPRQLSCHSFGDEPLKDWNDVYKVYYSYSVIQVYKEDNWRRTLFNCYCDKCFIINDVVARIKCIINDENKVGVLNYEMVPFGNGVSWKIDECMMNNNVVKSTNVYEITLWNWNNIGYRFYLPKDKLKGFGEYLSKCCEYMLANGESN